MNNMEIAVKNYICDLVVVLCSLVTALAQLSQVRRNWKASFDEQADRNDKT